LRTARLTLFDQIQINSFTPRQGRSSPLWAKLQERTYTRYKKVWKQLLCFVYRIAYQKQYPQLSHELTADQSEVAAANVAVRSRQDSKQQDNRLDEACLHLCITLLDHQLFGDIYESIVLSFFAVLGIRETPTPEQQSLTFHDLFSPGLSRLLGY